MDITPAPVQQEDTKPKSKTKQIVEQHHHHETIIERPVDRIVEKQVVVEKEKLVKVPEVHTEALYNQLANIGARIEESKQKLNQLFDQIKYVANDPSKFKRLEETIGSSFVDVKSEVSTIKQELHRSLVEVKNAIARVQEGFGTIKLPPGKDYSNDFSTVIKLIDNVSKPLVSLDKLDEIKSFLSVLKQSLDKINFNPVVNVTTQKIEDTKTVQALDNVNNILAKLHDVITKRINEYSIKADTVKATIEDYLPKIVQLFESLSTQLKTMESKIPKLLVTELNNSNVAESINTDLVTILDLYRTELINSYNDIDLKTRNTYELLSIKVTEEFERLVNQKLFDMTVDLKSTISSIVKEEINSYLKSFRVEVDMPNNDLDSLSYLSLIKETIQTTLDSQKKYWTYVVNSFEQLPTDYTNYVGRIILVKRLSFFKRNKSFICDGQGWQLL